MRAVADACGPGLRRGDDFGKSRCVYVADTMRRPGAGRGRWRVPLWLRGAVAAGAAGCKAAGGVALWIAAPLRGSQ